MKQNPQTNQTNPRKNPHTNQRKPKQTHKKEDKMKPTENLKVFMIQI